MAGRRTVTMRDLFDRFASASARILGSAGAFTLYVALIAAWLFAGPLMHYTDSWQLIANTTTTLFTTAVCLLIQHTVNKDSRALHLKLDELLRAVAQARTGLVDLQSWPEDDLERLQDQFRRLRSGESGERGPAPQSGDRREREDEAGR